MDVLVLIDKLDDLVHNAKAVPLTDQVRIDREEIYDILDQMRATIPEEIKQARWIVKERQEMLAEAKREQDRLLQEAREQAVREASQTEIVKLAERQAQEIIDEARRQAREMRLEMEDWADGMLATLETNLDKFLVAVRRGRERLHERSQESVVAGVGPVPGRERGQRGADDRVRRREHARPLGLGARRDRACAAGQDPLPPRLRGPLRRVRQEPERRAAHARGRARRPALGGPRSAPRRVVADSYGAAARRSMSTTSLHSPRLRASFSRTPTRRKPHFSCNAIDAAFAARIPAWSVQICAASASVHKRSSSARPSPRPRARRAM